MKVLYFFLFFFLFSLNFHYSQNPGNQGDTTRRISADTSGLIRSGNNEMLNHKVDSLLNIQSSYPLRISSLEEKINSLDNKLMIAYAIGGLSLLISLIALGYANSKARALKERLIVISKRRDLEDLEKKYLENKRRVSESIEDLSGRHNTFYNEFSKFKEVLINEVTALSLKLDASSSLTKNIESTAKKQESILSKPVERDIPGKPKTFLVEYYVDNGEIKFKETNSGTPFYMDKYDDRSELTVNEATYAPSNYSESIQKCFKVNGEMSGKYRNKLPALCSFDGNLNTWNLIQMGELDAL